MTTATKFSGQNDAASRTSTTYICENLVLVVALVLESKAFYCTVETRLTATWVIRSPRYYGHCFWPGKTAIHFVTKKNRNSPVSN